MFKENLVATPPGVTFTLEGLGLSADMTTDPVNDAGVLGINSENAPTAVFKTHAPDQPGGRTTSMSSKEISRIPYWVGKIVLIGENADKIVDMVEVQKDIEGGAGINRDKGDLIEATFEGFYSHNNPRNGFTQVPTNVNFQFSKNHMARVIRQTNESLITQFREVNTAGLSDIVDELQASREYCAQELRDAVGDAVASIQARSEILKAGAAILPFKGGKFVDMMKVNLLEVDLNDLENGVSLPSVFPEALEIMKTHFANDWLKELLTVISETRPMDAQVSDGLSVDTLLRIFDFSMAEKVYTEFVKNVDRTIQTLQQHMRHIHDEIEAGNSPAQMISSNSNELKTLAMTGSETMGRAQIFSEFIQSVTTVLLSLASIR